MQLKIATVCLVGLVTTGAAAIFPGSSPFVNPWVDTSMCLPGEPLAVCQLKKSKCSGVSHVFSGPAGPVATVHDCANATGAIPGPDFYLSIGLAFAKGTPEILSDLVSPDPQVSYAIRMCTLNSSGLLTPNMTLNRDTLATALNASLQDPGLATAAMVAAYSCPEPAGYHIASLLKCIKSACMNSIDMSSPMASGPSNGGLPASFYQGSTAGNPWAGGQIASSPWAGMGTFTMP